MGKLFQDLEDRKLDCRILEDTVLPSLHSKMGCTNHPNLDDVYFCP